MPPLRVIDAGARIVAWADPNCRGVLIVTPLMTFSNPPLVIVSGPAPLIVPATGIVNELMVVEDETTCGEVVMRTLSVAAAVVIDVTCSVPPFRGRIPLAS